MTDPNERYITCSLDDPTREDYGIYAELADAIEHALELALMEVNGPYAVWDTDDDGGDAVAIVYCGTVYRPDGAE